MELLFILLSLACQIILLSHASDWALGSQTLITLFGISFSGRGLMIISVIFLVLAAFFGVLRISDGMARKKEMEDAKSEAAQLKAEKAKSEAAQARQQEAQR